jgi:hypothetical protein
MLVFPNGGASEMVMFVFFEFDDVFHEVGFEVDLVDLIEMLGEVNLTIMFERTAVRFQRSHGARDDGHTRLRLVVHSAPFQPVVVSHRISVLLPELVVAYVAECLPPKYDRFFHWQPNPLLTGIPNH